MPSPAWLTARPIAHRGYHDAAAGRLENTLGAAEAAVAHNFSIECDVQLTADDAIVVFHDDTLDRLTRATGSLDRKTLAEVRAARFRASPETIPTLEELLDLIDGRVPLIIELKSRWTGDRRLEDAVAALLMGYTGPVAVMSFDPAAVIAMRQLTPDVPRGLIADRSTAADWPALSPPQRLANRWLLAAPFALPNFIAYDVAALPASPPLTLRHFFHLPLLTWTVRTPADRATARGWADQIIFEGFDPDAV